MKERPIIFSAPMVRAIIDGRKTQTRRIVKPQPPEWAKFPQPVGAGWEWTDRDVDADDLQHWPDYYKPMRCPYGVPGDRLVVRESGWERPERTPKMMREGADTWARYYYDAAGLGEQDAANFKALGFKRRPSIHMPRWASRITLEIVSVRVERLQEIGYEDAVAEGICHEYPKARAQYRDQWESIHGADSWAANPWVWVIEFRAIGANSVERGI